MLKTYRKWIDTKEVFYIRKYDEEDKNYYCEDTWWEDNRRFEEEYIEKESIPANIYDILKYKITKWLNEK